MAYDEGLACLIRDDLADLDGLSEKKMFGGLCFLQHGHMICGVKKDGAMFRVGKENETTALSIEGASPMTFTKRKMGGFVDANDDLMADDARRAKLTTLATIYVASLPPK